jgi:tetratricopeptide (TPR) repeat protein
MSKLGVQGSKIFKKDPSLGFLYFQKSLKKSSLYAPEVRSVFLKNFLENFQSFPPEKEGLKKEIFAFAVSEAKKSIEEHPKDVKYYIFLNKLYREGNLLKEAEEILKKALELSPTRQEIYYDLGQIKIFQKDFEAGANYYRKAVELAPEIADSHFYYGLSLIIDQKNEEGIKEIEKAYEMGKGIESENADALSVISAGYFGIKNYEKSLYFSELALKKDPHLLSALYLKTVSLFGLGEKEKAEETLKQIEAINKELAQKIRGSL